LRPQYSFDNKQKANFKFASKHFRVAKLAQNLACVMDEYTKPLSAPIVVFIALKIYQYVMQLRISENYNH